MPPRRTTPPTRRSRPSTRRPLPGRQHPRRALPGRLPLARLLLVLALLAPAACAPASARATPAWADAGAGQPRAAEAARYVLPAAGAHVVRAFEPPPQPWSAGHRGVDLAVVPGGPVVAPQAGVVAFAGDVAGRGVVTVRHDDGLTSSLEPVRPSVTVGTRVARGASVGVVDAPGHCAPVTCLHWGVRTAPTRYVDPLSLVGPAGPVVLLPG